MKVILLSLATNNTFIYTCFVSFYFILACQTTFVHRSIALVRICTGVVHIRTATVLIRIIVVRVCTRAVLIRTSVVHIRIAAVHTRTRAILLCTMTSILTYTVNKIANYPKTAFIFEYSLRYYIKPKN